MADPTPVVEVATLELEVENLGGSLDAAQERLAEFVAGVGARPAYRANLVFEELVTNALKYGGVNGEPPRVSCTVTVEASELVLEFRDRGRPFDPSIAPPPRRATTLDEATVGGLGLELVRKVASAMTYRRDSAENLTSVHLLLEPE
jgi:anti-sigma regulatory factor (Ser/Thr protein kinase)